MKPDKEIKLFIIHADESVTQVHKDGTTTDSSELDGLQGATAKQLLDVPYICLINKAFGEGENNWVTYPVPYQEETLHSFKANGAKNALLAVSDEILNVVFDERNPDVMPEMDCGIKHKNVWFTKINNIDVTHELTKIVGRRTIKWTLKTTGEEVIFENKYFTSDESAYFEAICELPDGSVVLVK